MTGLDTEKESIWGCPLDGFANLSFLNPTMSSDHTNPAFPARIWRAIAVLAAGMVMLLSASSVSPALHEWLHDLGQDHAGHSCLHHGTHSTEDETSDVAGRGDHQCAVTLFAQGHVLTALFIALLFLIVAVSPAPVFPARLLAFAAVDYAWPHSCGPPAA